ncbi:MAG TPA: hypothetical protein VLM40_02450 [Gemmata sp.]|nr:hypothetical protein [Gemmata sp.]
MRYIIPFIAALGAFGCGDPKPLPMAATPESSRAALVAALDGWKEGKSFEDLAGGSPPLIFQDDDLNRKVKLLSYTIEGEGKPYGVGYSYIVALTIEGKGKPRRVYYSVVTEPKQVVTREDRTP